MRETNAGQRGRDAHAQGPGDGPDVGPDVGAVIAAARQRLHAASIPNAAGESRLLLALVTGWSTAGCIANVQAPLDPETRSRFRALITRRARGEPYARLAGQKEFYSHDFAVSSDTLVPRPETETLVDIALEEIRMRETPTHPRPCILDLGTGSGCILIALLAAQPTVHGIGLDIAPGALRLAERNAKTIGVGSRARWICTDWWGALSPTTARFDGIVSNPPYVTDAEWARLDRSVSDFDPPIALRAGTAGLDAYRAILPRVLEFLKPSGFLALEISEHLHHVVGGMMKQHGLRGVRAHEDLEGRVRVLSATA